MKRFLVSLISTILAFTAGLVTASSWNSKIEMVAPVIANHSPPCPTNQPQPKATVQSYTVAPLSDFAFGQNGLRLVAERVQLKSESLGYDIDVSYPQLIGTPLTKETVVRKVNQHLKEEATQLYQWVLKSSEPPGYLQASSGIRNTVNFTYQVGLATDSFLSLSFIGYSYNGVTQRQLQDPFSINYDLTSGKALELSELFKPRSGYLEFISRYSMDALSSISRRGLTREALRPAAANFDAWNITTNGITFKFDACKVANCSEGEMIVQIPYSELRPMLHADIPGKFNITYP